MATLSVVMATYNKVHWVGEMLVSIFNQDYRPDEIVIYDDGSTDGTYELLRGLKKMRGDMKVFRGEQNTGYPSLPYQLALEKASGDYVSVVGADDMLLPNFYDDLMSYAKDHPDADLIYGNIVYMDGESVPIPRVYPPEPHLIYRKCSVGLVTSLMKKSMMDALGGFDTELTYSEDWDLMIRIFKSHFRKEYAGTYGYVGRVIAQNAEQVHSPIKAIDRKRGLIYFDITSPRRKNSHALILKMNGLPGPCLCGCKASPGDCV